MEYNRNRLYKFEYIIPKYSVRIKTNNESIPTKIDSIGLSFPFGLNITYKPIDSIKEIAKVIIIKLIDRRILNSKECCGSCIEQSVLSLKEIKAVLINEKTKLIKQINTLLYYYVDYIIIAINTFFDFTERYYEKKEEYRGLYFDALEKIRNHVAKCMKEILKIAEYEITNTHYAFRDSDLIWHEQDYSKKAGNTIEILV